MEFNERQAAMQAAMDFLKTLQGESPDDRKKKMQAYLSGRPEFTSAIIGTDSVWATFTDAREFVIFTEPLGDTSAASPSPPPPSQAAAPSPNSADAAAGDGDGGSTGNGVDGGGGNGGGNNGGDSNAGKQSGDGGATGGGDSGGDGDGGNGRSAGNGGAGDGSNGGDADGGDGNGGNGGTDSGATPPKVYTRLPASRRAVALNFFASQDPVDALNFVRKALAYRRYSVTDDVQVTADALLNLPSDIGVLFINTHGSLCPANSGPGLQGAKYVLLTSTDWSWELNTTDDGDRIQKAFTNKLVGYWSGSLVTDAGTIDAMKVHVTDKLIATWKDKLSANALVYLNACEGLNQFVKTCLVEPGDSDAPLIVGWEGSFHVLNGALTSQFVFDRFLGTNWYMPASLIQRPLTWEQIFSDLPFTGGIGISTDPHGNLVTLGAFRDPTADDGLATLAPSINYVGPEMATNDHVYVNGIFGNQLGDVQVLVLKNPSDVTGTSLVVADANSKMITCLMPGLGEDGAAGYFKVIVGETRPSNIVPLTELRGTVTLAVSGGQAQSKTVHTYHIRADLHAYRGAQLSPASYVLPPRISVTSKQSTCTYAASGTYTQDQCNCSISGSGSVDPVALALSNQEKDIGLKFQIYLNSTTQVDQSWNTTYSGVLTAANPGDSDNPPYKYHTECTCPADNSTSTSDILVFSQWAQKVPMPLQTIELGPQAINVDDVKIQTGCDDFGPGSTQVFTIHHEPTNYSPDPTLGEDYGHVAGPIPKGP